MSAFIQELRENNSKEVVDRVVMFVDFAEDASHMSRDLLESTIMQFDADNFLDEARDISTHGFMGGIDGWSHFDDTSAFFEANKTLIIEWLEEFKNEVNYHSVSDFLLNSEAVKEHGFNINDIELFLTSDANDAPCYKYFANSLSLIVGRECCSLYINNYVDI